MPGLTGLDALIKLKEARIDSKVVVLTMHNDAERATQALKAGASAFLLKESAGEELVTAIHQALQGRVYLTAAVTRSVIDRMADSGGETSSKNELTPRQLEVLRLIVKGQRMKEIAVDAAAVDADRRNPQIRNDAGARPALHRGTGSVRDRASLDRRLTRTSRLVSRLVRNSTYPV